LIGKKAIVTGGDSGIGRACAVMYGMEGADVRLFYHQARSLLILRLPLSTYPRSRSMPRRPSSSSTLLAENVSSSLRTSEMSRDVTESLSNVFRLGVGSISWSTTLPSWYVLPLTIDDEAD
jgi:hypothetical protein